MERRPQATSLSIVASRSMVCRMGRTGGFVCIACSSRRSDERLESMCLSIASHISVNDNHDHVDKGNSMDGRFRIRGWSQDECPAASYIVLPMTHKTGQPR
jgi:hypothetical protein